MRHSTDVEYAVYKSMQTGGVGLVRNATTIPDRKGSSSRRMSNRTVHRSGSKRYRDSSKSRLKRSRFKRTTAKRKRADRNSHRIKSNQNYQKSYQEGFNQGFAKGYEDGHQLFYANQV